MFEYVGFQFILISEEFEALLIMVIGQSGVQFREYFQIGQAICNYESITPELYDTKSYDRLIVSIIKCENLSLGIFINVNKSDWTS